ncbi:MAG TPA: cell division protein SepF [Pseudoclavibacter sp.]|nr:cell division protein SepF [Pseudoclavibacter sp.]
MAHAFRKTLEYLGLAEENLDEQEEAPTVQAVPSTAPASQTPSRPTVTQFRRPSGKAATPEMNEILTVHPKKYADAQIIAESFREGIPVIINLSQMSEPDARRLIDFSSGLASGLLGKIERVTPKVFLLSPSYITVSGPQTEDASTEGAALFVEN